MTTTLIWDWNGTLLNDVSANHGILNAMLRKRGLQHIAINHYRKLFRMPIKDFYHDCGFTFANESYSDVAREFFQMYRESFPSIPLSDGGRETLDAISRKGVRQYIVSALHEPVLHYQVREKGIFDYFDGIAGLDDIHATSKVQRAVDLVTSLKINGSLLLVGDMDHDYMTAKAINARCVLYTGGHQFITGYSDAFLIDRLDAVIKFI